MLAEGWYAQACRKSLAALSFGDRGARAGLSRGQRFIRRALQDSCTSCPALNGKLIAVLNTWCRFQRVSNYAIVSPRIGRNETPRISRYVTTGSVLGQRRLMHGGIAVESQLVDEVGALLLRDIVEDHLHHLVLLGGAGVLQESDIGSG